MMDFRSATGFTTVIASPWSGSRSEAARSQAWSPEIFWNRSRFSG
jgi:hypothetical protein